MQNMSKNWAKKEEDRREDSYPFVESSKRAKEFANKEADRTTVEEWLTPSEKAHGYSSTYIEVVGKFLPGLLDTHLNDFGTSSDFPYTEALLY